MSGLGALATLGAGSDGLRTVYSTFYGQILSFVFLFSLEFVSSFFCRFEWTWLGEPVCESKGLIAVVGEFFSDSGCSPHTSQRRPGFKTFATLSAIPGSQATGDRPTLESLRPDLTWQSNHQVITAAGFCSSRGTTKESPLAGTGTCWKSESCDVKIWNRVMDVTWLFYHSCYMYWMGIDIVYQWYIEQ